MQKMEGREESSIQQKKKSKGTNAPASIQAPTGEANSNGTGVARARPASEVNVTPTGARQSTMSPMTGGESLGDSTAATATTNNSVIETNELLQRMITSDLNGQGDGGDSDAEGDGFNISNDLSAPVNDSSAEQQMNDRDEIEDNVLDSDDHFVMAESSTEQKAPCTLFGAPDGWHPPGPKEGWVYKRKADKNEPLHESVDNPGRWSNYTYKAKFAGRGGHGPYSHHQMPAGARPVPMDSQTGKRKRGDWEFHYQGWKQTDDNPSFVRKDASRDNIFPSNPEDMAED